MDFFCPTWFYNQPKKLKIIFVFLQNWAHPEKRQQHQGFEIGSIGMNGAPNFESSSLTLHRTAFKITTLILRVAFLPGGWLKWQPCLQALHCPTTNLFAGQPKPLAAASFTTLYNPTKFHPEATLLYRHQSKLCRMSTCRWRPSLIQNWWATNYRFRIAKKLQWKLQQLLLHQKNSYSATIFFHET